MRYVKEALDDVRRPDAKARDAFFALLGASDPVRATGVNLVMTRRDLARARIPTF